MWMKRIIDFDGRSARELVHKYDNLLVVQTFSKSRSMAGMRIGYAFGNKDLIKALNDVKFSFNSYTMNAPTLAYGVAAVKMMLILKNVWKKLKIQEKKRKSSLWHLVLLSPILRQTLFLRHISAYRQRRFLKN